MEGLGSRIKLIRDTRSQEDFATSLGIDRSTLGSYEIDRREPDLKTLLLIAKLGGVSLDWLSGRINVSIDLAVDYNITPKKLHTLIEVALTLKEA